MSVFMKFLAIIYVLCITGEGCFVVLNILRCDCVISIIIMYNRC